MTKTHNERVEEVVKELSEKVTDYGYNDEYGYYADWKDGVEPIIRATLLTLRREWLEERVKKMEGMKEKKDYSYQNIPEENTFEHILIDGHNSALQTLIDADRTELKNINEVI